MWDKTLTETGAEGQLGGGGVKKRGKKRKKTNGEG
jgi:hypothetical protein